MTRTDLPPLRVAITGGTSGLGAALVTELLGRHAQVAFLARHRDVVEQAHQRFQRVGPGRVHAIVGDVARKDDIHPIAIQILAALGGDFFRIIEPRASEAARQDHGRRRHRAGQRPPPGLVHTRYTTNAAGVKRGFE